MVCGIDVFGFDPTSVVTVVVSDILVDEYSPPRTSLLFAGEEMLNLESSSVCIPRGDLGSHSGHEVVRQSSLARNPQRSIGGDAKSMRR